MISFPFPGADFNYRVAAVAIRDGHVLMHRAVHDDFWALPGGRCEIMEPSSEAIVREMREETGESIRVERLLWVVENFFTYDHKRRHVLGLYYLVSLPPASRLLDLASPHAGVEGDLPLLFQWLPIIEAPRLPIYPIFLSSSAQPCKRFPTASSTSSIRTTAKRTLEPAFRADAGASRRGRWRFETARFEGSARRTPFASLVEAKGRA